MTDASEPNQTKHDNFYHYHDDQYNCTNPDCNVTKFRNPDGTVRLRNPNIKNLDGDFLYHLALGSGTDDLVKMFSDVKFVCMGGTAKRMELFAGHIMGEIGYQLPTGTILHDISIKSLRFAMYKVGPVLCVNHGMGIPSISILLHEIIKLMYHAKVKDPIFFRIGTCGGIGLPAGSVVVSEGAVDELCNNHHEQVVCGKIVRRPAILDKRLAEELAGLSEPDDGFKLVTGLTLSTNCFYEGQGRTDGAICEHTEQDKLTYLLDLQSKGIKNIEMESTVFAAMTHYCGIKAGIVNVTLLDRLQGDQVTTPKDELMGWQSRPQVIVARFIKQYLANANN